METNIKLLTIDTVICLMLVMVFMHALNKSEEVILSAKSQSFQQIENTHE